MKLILSKACSKYGAQMGRRDMLPADPRKPIKLHLQRLPMVDGDYDRGGAYWGCWSREFGGMWAAWGEDEETQVQVFTRATTRGGAKNLVLMSIPGAKFYR